MKSVCSRIFHLYRVGDYTAYENIQRDFEVKYIVLFMDDNILREVISYSWGMKTWGMWVKRPRKGQVWMLRECRSLVRACCCWFPFFSCFSLLLCTKGLPDWFVFKSLRLVYVGCILSCNKLAYIFPHLLVLSS